MVAHGWSESQSTTRPGAGANAGGGGRGGMWQRTDDDDVGRTGDSRQSPRRLRWGRALGQGKQGGRGGGGRTERATAGRGPPPAHKGDEAGVTPSQDPHCAAGAREGQARDVAGQHGGGAGTGTEHARHHERETGGHGMRPEEGPRPGPPSQDRPDPPEAPDTGRHALAQPHLPPRPARAAPLCAASMHACEGGARRRRCVWTRNIPAPSSPVLQTRKSPCSRVQEPPGAQPVDARMPSAAERSPLSPRFQVAFPALDSNSKAFHPPLASLSRPVTKCTLVSSETESGLWHRTSLPA